MGKRRTRYRSNRYRKDPPWVALLILLLLGFFFENWQPILILALIIGAIVVTILVIKRKKQNSVPSQSVAPSLPEQEQSLPQVPSAPTYSAKDSMMTDCERGYYEAIKELIGTKYFIQPQVNLASVINKQSQSKYRNELFRNIDFGIFDSNYHLLVLIEINDSTHENQNRRERDQKIRTICAEANIPLIVFWTKYGIDRAYIKQRLCQYLNIEETLS